MGVHDKITTLSTKGQVILPKPIRDGRRWGPGMRLVVEEVADGVLLRPAPAFAATELDAVFGTMRPKGPALTPEQMDAAIAAEARRRARD